MQEIEKGCPHAEGLHLIVEIGWVPSGTAPDRAALHKDIFDRSVKYLQKLIE